jgi:hypothetical protein
MTLFMHSSSLAPTKCGMNEVFYCGPTCPDSEASCSNLKPPACITRNCVHKCFCKKDFVRGDYNACIPAKKCRKYWVWYIRSAMWIHTWSPYTMITSFTQLPLFSAKPCTQPHERYSNCVLAECVPKTCDDLGKPLSCLYIAPPCAGGCICEEGYVRNKDGNCINAKACRKYSGH